MKGDRVEIVVDTGTEPRTYEVSATRAGRRVDVSIVRNVVTVAEVTRGQRRAYRSLHGQPRVGAGGSTPLRARPGPTTYRRTAHAGRNHRRVRSIRVETTTGLHRQRLNRVRFLCD